MTQLLKLKGHEKILEVGTGSGYQAAVLAYLASEVHTIERHKELGRDAEGKLKELGITNVQVHIGDGSQGIKKYAPYDRILVTAAAPSLPLLSRISLKLADALLSRSEAAAVNSSSIGRVRNMISTAGMLYLLRSSHY